MNSKYQSNKTSPKKTLPINRYKTTNNTNEEHKGEQYSPPTRKKDKEHEDKKKKVIVTPDINLKNIMPIKLTREATAPTYLELQTSNSTVFKKLTYNKPIAKGSFGMVLLYGNESSGMVALKITDDEQEKQAVTTFNISDCNLVGCRLLPVIQKSKIPKQTYVPSYYYIAMTYCDGTLMDIIGEMYSYDLECKHNLITSITKQIKCLYTKTKPLCYIDLKPANILFKCTDKKVKVLVGDLGSIYVCDPNSFGSSTYPYPFEYDNEDEVFSRADEKSVVWGLFVVLMIIYCKTEEQSDSVLTLFQWANIHHTQDVEDLVMKCMYKSGYTKIFSDFAKDPKLHTFKGFEQLLTNKKLQ